MEDGGVGEDVQRILSHRHDNGADLWATGDGDLLKGAPFSTLESVRMLAELGVPATDPVLTRAAELIFTAWRDDGRFRLSPSRGMLPCHTAHAAAALTQLGHAEDPRLQRTFDHLLETSWGSGGWRCNKFSFGRGPETELANPHPTLMALHAFQLGGTVESEPVLDRAVDLLLEHWTTRAPIGPCHYGIGTLFLQVEYPFRTYNLFFWVYVLSFFPRARADSRFAEALAVLHAGLVDGRSWSGESHPG
jgi:hypothetical protein